MPIPDYVQKYLDLLKAGGTKYSVRAELDAFARMQADIDREKSPQLKQFMRDTLVYCCTESAMLLSYVYENVWREWIREQKALRRDVQPIALYIALESILAGQSDSSGYTKTVTSSRYPWSFPVTTRDSERCAMSTTTCRRGSF